MAQNVRRATPADLPGLYRFYGKAVRRMQAEDRHLWDDVYPACCLADDVAAGQLYIVEDGTGAWTAAFVLTRENAGASAIPWEQPAAPAAYLERLAADVDRPRQGLGLAAVAAAETVARKMGAAAVRLFAAVGNDPAVALYCRAGYRISGSWEEPIDETLRIPEYGMEKML